MPKGKPNKRYTPEFKTKVVETMQKKHLIYRKAAKADTAIILKKDTPKSVFLMCSLQFLIGKV